MKYQIFHKYQDSGWLPTNLYSTDLENIIRKAQECSKNAIAYGMTAVVEANTNHHLTIVEFPGGGGKPRYIHPGYESKVLAALGQKVEISPKKGCSDCKDGFYYPLVGSREPCPTCRITNDSKFIIHLQDVWADYPWGLTKISKPSITGCTYAVNAHVIVKSGDTPEIINDKLVDRIVEGMTQYKVTQFYEYEPPTFNIINFPNRNREINVCLTIGFLA